MIDDTTRVRIWKGRYDRENYPETPDETVAVPTGGTHLWQDDPWYDSGPVAFDVHPVDAPATLYLYTNDSVRAPNVPEEPYNERTLRSEWGTPIERGLPFDSERYDDYPPFGCEVWGRVLFYIEEGLTRD